MGVFIPRRCNLCGGAVIYAPSSYVYGGHEIGTFVYVCRRCGAYVGTHKNNPKCALGILADNEMRELRKRCHQLFDGRWSNGRERTEAYAWLAGQMELEKCHFAWMDKEQLKRAVEILERTA